KKICGLQKDPLRKFKAAKFYRDRLGWAVHPLRGPKDSGVDEKARGKAPLIKGWKNWTIDDATDAILQKHFANGHDSNLGVVVRPPYICIDLDSKKDKGRSVNAWLIKQPKLAKVPRERTGGGVHLHFRCPDLPEFTKNGKPHKHALVSKLNVA